MAIRTYLSNDQIALANKCAENLASFKSVFRPVNIVTQTAGMNRWLSIHISEQNGVFSNFNFQTPSGLVSQLFRLAKLPMSDAYQTEKTRWLVYEILASPEFIGKFPKVAQYYHQDKIKQLQLATKVADLFDQYFVYRPDYIQAWNNGQQNELEQVSMQEHQEWQAYIWSAAKNRLEGKGSDMVHLKEALVQKFHEADFAELLREKITGISLFGLSILTEYHLEIIHELSRCIQVDLYFLNPAPTEFWYDNKDQNLIAYIERKTGKSKEELYLHDGNTLLANLGKAGQNSFAVFFNDSDFINSVDDSLTKEPKGSSLLSTIQQDLFYNKTDEERGPIPIEQLMDGSILINSCFTTHRELEAVHDYLLFQFEKNPDLQARDVLVMCSDIDTYAPYIEAVFDSAPPALKIPYAIADQSFKESRNLIALIEQVFQLNNEQFSPEKVLQIAENPLVARQYELKEFHFLQELVDQCNIRVGISGSEADHSHYISWKFGLEKIVLSYAMADQAAFDNGSYTNYAISNIEGEFAREAMRFYAFASDLIRLKLDTQGPRTLKGWKDYVDQVLDCLCAMDLADSEEFNTVQSHLAKLDDVQAFFGNSVPFEVFKNAFLSSLFSNQRSGNFITGRVTFSSMIPLRSIPFKIVGMLGLDRDKYPRKEDKLGFNLMDAEKRRSDRNIRDNDKYLFLESILSAKDAIYFSYLGQNPKDGTRLLPSIVLDELINYISRKTGQSFADTSNILVEQQALHGFSSNTIEPRIPQYSNSVGPYKGIKILDQAILHHTAHLELEQFLQFFQDPFKFHYNKVLAVYLEEQDELIKESEIFELDALQTHWLKQEILKESFDYPSFVDRYEKSGALPLSNMAFVPVDIQLSELEEVKEQKLQLIDNQPPNSIFIDLALKSHRVAGQIQNVHGITHVIVNTGSAIGLVKRKIRMTMLALISEALDLNLELHLISTEGLYSLGEKKLGKVAAMEKLEKLMEFYLRGLDEVLCFSPITMLDKWRQKPGLELLKEIKKEGEINDFKTWNNPYISQESSQGYFENNAAAKGKYVDDIRSVLLAYE